MSEEMSVTWKDYVDTMFARLQTYIDVKFSDSQRALSDSRAANEIRLEGMNEFRAQLEKERTQYVRRAELFAVVGGVLAVITIMMSVLFFVLKKP